MKNSVIENEFLHHDLYGKAIEAAKKMTSRKGTRPILETILHDVNGDIYATDSHRLIQVKNIHGFKEEFLVNPRNGMFSKGKYPPVDPVVNPSNELTKVIHLDQYQIKLWWQLFKSYSALFKGMKLYDKSVGLYFKDKLTLEIPVINENGILTELPTESYEKPEGVNHVYFAVDYMRDALEAHCNLESKELNIYIQGHYRPIIMDDENMVKTIILPVRKY